MHTFDQSLAELYKDGKISRQDALDYATSKNNLEWMLNFKGQEGGEEKSTTSKVGITGVLPELNDVS